MSTAHTDHGPRWLLSGTAIEGLGYRALNVNHDGRGAFTEVFRDDWGAGLRPRQWSVVNSGARVLRGMHVHLGHDEYMSVIQGSALIGLFDLRRHSRTYRAHALIELRGNAPACITFPRGILHGWYFAGPSVHLQGTSSTFAEYGRHDNWGCHFADPALGIPWPDPQPVLSQRARHFPSLDSIEAILEARRTAPESAAGASPWGDTRVTRVDTPT